MRNIYTLTYLTILILFIIFFYPLRLPAQTCITTNPVISASTNGITTSSVAQSFTISGCADGTLEDVTVFSFSNNTGITLRIFEGEGTGGTELFSATNLSLNAGTPLSNQFPISPAIPFETDDVFTFKLELTGGGSFQLAKSSLVNSYSDGQLYENDIAQANEDLFFIITASASALPVEMSYFEVQSERSDVQVNWQTITEINNEGFEIQRSSDGIRWDAIGYVEGQGTTSIPVNYSFVDNTPLSGTSFYRLKQIDYDGAYEFSDIRSVQWTNTIFSNNQISCYPNPANQGQFISLSGIQQPLASIQLLTLNGQSILTTKTNTNKFDNSRDYRLQLPTDLITGFYVIKVQFVSGQSSTSDLLWIQ